MTLRNWGIGGIVFGLALAAWTCVGQAQPETAKEAQPGTGERVGERVDDALRDIKRGVGEAAAEVRERFGRARAAVHDMGIEARVYSRIHWDKALNGATIDLTETPHGAHLVITKPQPQYPMDGSHGGSPGVGTP